MSYAEYTPLQWFLPFLRGGYRLPVSDLPADRLVERPMPRSLHPGDWGNHPAADDIIRLPSPMPKGGLSAQGRPVQTGHATARTQWHVTPAYGGASFSTSVPVPAQGDYWVEGAPRPLWTTALHDVPFDKHVIVTDPRGGWFEMIGATNWGAWRCSGLAQYDRHGELVKGRPVIAAKRSLLPLLWNRHDMPHLCTITMRGSDNDPNDAQHLGKWLVLDASRVDRPTTDDGGRLWDALTTFGCIYGDHGGVSNVPPVSGAQWDGVDWGGLAFRLSDFLIAT